MLNVTEYRDSCASTDEEDDALECHPLNGEITNDDSESEFNKVLQMCRKHRDFTATEIEEGKPRILTKPNKVFDSEYYSLPAIELLNIQLREETEFKRFGVVESHISFLAKIRPDKHAPHLGYETILFDHDKKPVGEIFEIFGTVTETLYALRFNDEAEALARLPVGEVIYYADEDTTVTKPVFPTELEKLKGWDRFRPPGDSSSSEEVFSDDEEEKRHLARKRQKTREESKTNISNDIPKKRSKTGTNRLGRPFTGNHSVFPRQIYPSPYPTTHYNNYMPMYPQYSPHYHHLPAAVPLPLHWTCPPPPPPPVYPSTNAFFTPPPYFSTFQNFNSQSHQPCFNQQGYILQRPNGAQGKNTQK